MLAPAAERRGVPAGQVGVSHALAGASPPMGQLPARLSCLPRWPSLGRVHPPALPPTLQAPPLAATPPRRRCWLWWARPSPRIRRGSC
jgi:hypothetical protein